MVKLIKSSFYHEEETKKALAEFILKTDNFSMGEQCRKFEQVFAKKQGRKFAAYVANGSVANLLLIQTLLNTGRLKRGDNVGFSALTWPTNVMPLIQLGLNPVAIDCSPETLNITPLEVQKVIPEIQALFLTNVLGFCDDIVSLRQLCGDEGVILIEDNCESLGSQVGDELLGNFGLASTFSFFVGHHMSTIEGGMICTDDEDLYDQLIMGRAHGWDRNLAPEKQAKLRAKHNIDEFYSKYTFYDLASNFRPSEINGFIGNIQINYWDEIVQKRVDNFKRFKEAIDSNDDFCHMDINHMNVVSNFSMPVICKSSELAVTYRQKFEESQVELRPVIAGDMTKQPFYKKYVKYDRPMPNSMLVHENGFYFGNNPEMTPDEVDLLCNLVRK